MKEDPFNNKKDRGDNKLGRESSPDIKSNMLESTKKVGLQFGLQLPILGFTILITMYGETMLLPAIRDIIREFNISYSTLHGSLQHISSRVQLQRPSLASCLIYMGVRKWFYRY